MYFFSKMSQNIIGKYFYNNFLVKYIHICIYVYIIIYIYIYNFIYIFIIFYIKTSFIVFFF